MQISAHTATQGVKTPLLIANDATKTFNKGIYPLVKLNDQQVSSMSSTYLFRFRKQFITLIGLLTIFGSLALAHEGFNIVLENASVNPYTLTILEDTHVDSKQPQTSLMLQIANGREAAPADTTVKLRLENSSGTLYENEVPYVGSSSSDGRSFYAYYFVTIPLNDLNSYELKLELSGSLGTAETIIHFQPKLAPEFRATELIPSLIILSICLAAVVMFIVSSRQPSQKSQVKKGLYHA
jgi:hypothetical protein